jgi:DNA-binding transcriptional LysR family regulator
MECHPCYQWLLKVVSPYLARWPDVDVDVKQRFQFGGIGALFGYEIDVLVTPDPLNKPGLRFEPVFDYEQVLVVAESHRWRPALRQARAARDEVLITYPVETDRLDIYNQFLRRPASCRAPQDHRDHRHHVADGRQPARRGAAEVARGGIRRSHAARHREARQTGHRQADFSGHARRRRGARLPELIRRIRARVELAGVATDALMNALTNALIAPASGRVRAGLPSRSRASRSRETTAILFISRMLQTRRFVFVSKRLAKCISGEHAGPLSGRHA